MKSLFGLPLFGVILPFIGKRRIPLNRDGSVVDTGLADILDERGPYYVKPLVFEWLGFGFGLEPSRVHSTIDDAVVDPPWRRP